MMISTTTQTRKKNKIKLWTIAFWLLLWQFASMALDKQILLASPLSVGRCLLSLVRTFSFWESIWFSLERIALGFFCAAAGGDMVFTDLEEIDSIIKQHKNTSGYQSEMNR
jgi:NitT/TauT family transport system permease protein